MYEQLQGGKSPTETNESTTKHEKENELEKAAEEVTAGIVKTKHKTVCAQYSSYTNSWHSFP